MNKRSKKLRLIFIVAIIAASIGFSTATLANAVEIPTWENLHWRLDIMYQNPDSFIRHFSPTWRSIKKIGDLYYLPQTLFHKSELPVYEITLTRADLRLLLDSLPALAGGKPHLTEEHKASVKGTFRNGEMETDVRVRYRGVLPNHWSARKKSWNITLLDENTGDEIRTLRLFIPEDRSWAAELLEAYRARKFGVLTPSIEFVKLKLNGHDLGVYMSIEGFDQSFLEYNNRPVGDMFSEQDIEDRPDYMRVDSLEFWQARIHKETNPYKENIAEFLHVISDTTDEEFTRRIPTLLDMEKMYGWMLESLIARNYHQKNSGNLNFYYDPERHIFEPIAYDMFSRELGDTYEVAHNRLVNRVLQQEQFRVSFETKARAYVYDPENLKNDLAYYDAMAASIEKDIMADTAKLPPTYLFFSYTERHRNEIIANFEKVRQWLENGELPITFAEEIYPL